LDDAKLDNNLDLVVAGIQDTFLAAAREDPRLGSVEAID
jgi:hypothetical protein